MPWSALSLYQAWKRVAGIDANPELCGLPTATGAATLIGGTDLSIGGVAGVNGIYYAFNNINNQVTSLNLANGQTSFVSNFDPAAGPIFGAATTPEPSSIWFVCLGIAGLAISKRR